MTSSLFSNTPTVTVLDNRGLQVRELAYYRHPDNPATTQTRITRHQYDARSTLRQSADPRLFTRGLANATYLTDLAGNVLRADSVDAGTTVSLNDAAGRPCVSVIGLTATDGEDDASQAVTRTWQYEEASLPGRPLSIMEKTSDGGTRVTERYVYAENTADNKALNLAGQCVRHYDPSGRIETNSIGLTGAPLSVSQTMLDGADDITTIADWQGGGSSAWDDLLGGETFTSLTTTDATGAAITTTDAKGNLQRVAVDVAGLLTGSWLTLKGGAEQVIVKSLTYSAAGQKLREVHGNGVVTTYTYEPETLRLIGIKTERPSGHASGAKVLQDLRYEYDPVGNVLNIGNEAEEARFWRNQKVAPENTYSYDSLYQLVSAAGRELVSRGQQGVTLPPASIPLPTDSNTYTNYTRTYSYDEAGNLTKIQHSSPAANNSYTTNITVSERSNRGVLSTLTDDPTKVDAFFTAGGQQIQLQPGGGNNLTWTPRNELQAVSTGADIQEFYHYDGSSQRTMKVRQQSAVDQWQVWYLPGLEYRKSPSESLQVITVGEAGRAQVRVLHWESGKPADIGNDQVRYSYDNLIGSSALEVDGDGQVISIEEYYPYGGTAVWTARSAIEADYKTIRYSGKERDATGLYYYGYRYYQPWVGRWLSSDPAGTVDGLNLYNMVNNNPVNYTDHLGLSKLERIVSAGKSAFKAHSLYSKAKDKITPVTETVKTISKITPGGLTKQLIDHGFDKSIDKSRKKILHGTTHSILDTKYYIGHMRKMKKKDAIRKGGGKGAMIAQHAPIIGAAIGAGVGYVKGKLGSNISRLLGKKINRVTHAILPNHSVIAEGVSVAASVQISSRMNGGGSTGMTTLYAEAVVAGRGIIASNSAALTQERTDIIGFAATGAKMLNAENDSPALRGAAIIAFGLEEKPTAKDTEAMGYAAAIGSEWTQSAVNTAADEWLPASISGYVKSHVTPGLATIGAAAYSAQVAKDRQIINGWIEFD